MGEMVGSRVRMRWLYEDVFKKTVTDATDKAFGRQQVISYSTKENREKVWEYSSREMQTTLPLAKEGAFTVEGVIANPFPFHLALGKTTTTGSGAAHVHTIIPTDKLKSFRVTLGIDTADAYKSILAQGCVCKTLKLNLAVGEPCKFTMTVPFADYPAAGTTWISHKLETIEPYIFNHVTSIVPDTGVTDRTNFGTVQKLELTIDNGTSMEKGFGDRGAVLPLQQALNIDGTMTILMENLSMFDEIRDALNTNTGFVVSMSNGTEYIKLDISYAFYNEWNPEITTNMPLKETIPFYVKSITVTATDSLGKLEFPVKS